LGQFNLPVTITPASNTTFFIDPTNGNDAFPGTAAKPWQFVRSVLDITKLPGLKVATVANAGNDVVVTILGGTNTENVTTGNIETPNLSVGSVTVLQAPSPQTFTLNMGGNNRLVLNKGYKLQDIKITSDVSANTGVPVVKINHLTAGLASVEVKCDVASGQDLVVTCVEVAGAGFHILRDVRVDVVRRQGSIGIQNNDPSASLSIIGGRVQPIAGPTSITQGPITLIESKGVLTVTGLEVDMTNGGHAKNSTGIVLKAAGSSVTGSTIKVNDGVAPGNATGIDVQTTASPSTVEGNTFIGFGSNTIGVKGNINLSSNALLKNNFSGTFGTPVQ
jgi:hypothetical protein